MSVSKSLIKNFMSIAPYKLKDGVKNEYEITKDDKGNAIHVIAISAAHADPLVKIKLTWDCTSYCLQKEHGPQITLMLNCEQWEENKMLCKAKQKVAVMSNVKKRIQRPMKRLRVSSSDEEDN